MASNIKIDLKDKVNDREIDLSMCNLQEVPVKEIAVYTKVNTLDLSNNHIVKLPKKFPTLTNLVSLDLSKNKLKSLPDNFGELTKLRHLDLYKNELEHLPISFGDLKRLKWLDLKDNPLMPKIKEIAGPCLDEKQCHACATNMVNFYTQVKEVVNVESENREKQRQKDKQASEVATQKQKHQEKKNKRKEKLKQQEEKPLIVKTEVKQQQKTPTQPKKPSTNLSTYLLRYISRYLLLILLFSVFFFICTAMKLKGTEGIEKKVVEGWKYVLSQAPPVLQEFGNTTGKYIFEVHQNLGKCLLQLQHNENIIYFSDKVKSYYNYIISK